MLIDRSLSELLAEILQLHLGYVDFLAGTLLHNGFGKINHLVDMGFFTLSNCNHDTAYLSPSIREISSDSVPKLRIGHVLLQFVMLIDPTIRICLDTSGIFRNIGYRHILCLDRVSDIVFFCQVFCSYPCGLFKKPIVLPTVIVPSMVHLPRIEQMIGGTSDITSQLGLDLDDLLDTCHSLVSDFMPSIVGFDNIPRLDIHNLFPSVHCPDKGISRKTGE